MKESLLSLVLGLVLVTAGTSQTTPIGKQHPVSTVITAGIGYMDLINFGGGIKVGQSDILLRGGLWNRAEPNKILQTPGQEPGTYDLTHSSIAFSANYAYHFAGEMKYSDQRRFYVGAGLQYHRYKVDASAADYSWWTKCSDIFQKYFLGGELYITPWLGMQAEVGVTWTMGSEMEMHEDAIEIPKSEYLGGRKEMNPMAEWRVFVRF